MNAHNRTWPPTWRADYERILAALPPTERRMLHDVVTSGVIEGDIPDLKTVARLADMVTGKITGDQYRAELLRELAERRKAPYHVAGTEQRPSVQQNGGTTAPSS